MEYVMQYLRKMAESFLRQISTIALKDVADILIVAVILYYVFKFIRDRRSGKLALGLIVLLALQIVSGMLNLSVLHFIMQNVFQVGLIALVILFQPELRSALEKMGGGSIRGLRSITETRQNENLPLQISALCEALCDLSKTKTGALVVIERSTKLGDVINSGVVINADVSPFLIRNIFFNKAPLHDGAMILRGGRIWAAGCFLPLSTNNDIVKDLGTRHRAAIGMSENSDAVVLVVSEETGTISLAVEGKLLRNLDYTSLSEHLYRLLGGDKTKNGMRSVFFRKDAKSGKKKPRVF